jgi:proteasome lid subunit RPN8/RPN11
MIIAPDLLERVVEHAQRDKPDECCGLVGVQGGVAVSVHELENLAHSPFRFEVDGMTLLKVLDEIESAGGELGAIYHSHTRSDPYPSQTDITFAANWPGVEWLIVGTKTPEPVVRSYLIEGGAVTEVDVAHGA